MMDSTTITLFDNILKGVGRHQKSGKKKGGMKVHTVMKYHVGVPMVVRIDLFLALAVADNQFTAGREQAAHMLDQPFRPHEMRVSAI